MDLELTGRLAVVTGASKGIGQAVARELAAEGCNLLLTARDQAALEGLATELRAKHGVEVEISVQDLATQDGQEALAALAGQADILINVAGAIPGGEIDVLSDADWRQGWELKVFGYINLCRLLYRQMKSRGRGVIINVIGMAGLRLDAQNIAGSTGNAALMAFSKCLGARSVDFGVRVVGLNPSLTETDRAVSILRNRAEREFGDGDRWREFVGGLPMGRLGQPEEIAHMVAFLVSGKASYVSGSIVNVDGGLGGRP
jgi:3-oxoacyl-[acyl-carrier protein] reductase